MKDRQRARHQPKSNRATAGRSTVLSSLCLPSVCCSLFCPGDRELQVPWGRMCRPQYMYLSRKTGLLNSPRPLGAMESGPIKSNDIVQRLVACLCALGRAQKLGSKDLAEERKKMTTPVETGWTTAVPTQHKRWMRPSQAMMVNVPRQPFDAASSDEGHEQPSRTRFTPGGQDQ